MHNRSVITTEIRIILLFNLWQKHPTQSPMLYNHNKHSSFAGFWDYDIGLLMLQQAPALAEFKY